MTVHVTMLPSAQPAAYDGDRTIIYDDEQRKASYTYSVKTSGSLAVVAESGGKVWVEVVYGPGAWESVQGDVGKIE